MIDNTTLFGAILVVGVLAYVGSIAFDPSHPLPRLIVGYLCGTALILIGAGSFYFGAAFELPLVTSGVYFFDPLHMEWLGLGLVALFVGAMIVRQAYTRG
jgi:hypothetical protein